MASMIRSMEKSVADKMHDKGKKETPKEERSDKKPPLGSGARFAALKKKLAAKPGVTDPGALAASIGRKKFGKKKFQSLSKGK